MDPVLVGMILLTLLLLGLGGAIAYVYTLRAKQAHEVSLAASGAPTKETEAKIRLIEQKAEEVERRLADVEANLLASKLKKRRA
jgi:hypothetical protein